MHDPKPTTAVDTPPDEPNEERIAGQGDDLDRGTGLGASGGGLGKTTGFWPEKPMTEDLKKSGTDPDFNASLTDTKGTTP